MNCCPRSAAPCAPPLGQAARRPRAWVCCVQGAVASSRAMPAAQSSISGQSRKSPSGRAARAAGSLRSDRSAKVSFLGSSAPKNTWRPRGCSTSVNSGISFGTVTVRRSRPLASAGSVPSGPLLNSHTGLAARTFRVAPHELRGFLAPVQLVRGAPDHERVVAGQITRILHRAHFGLAASRPQARGDPPGDPPGGAVLARIHDKNRHLDHLRFHDRARRRQPPRAECPSSARPGHCTCRQSHPWQRAAQLRCRRPGRDDHRSCACGWCFP